MNTQAYQVEYDDMGISVVSSQGIVATYGSAEDAFAAMRIFADKSFPENWNKVPPSMAAAKKRMYGSRA